MPVNVFALLDQEVKKLQDEAVELDGWPSDSPWQDSERGPTPLETKLGRRLAIVKELRGYAHDKADITLKTIKLCGSMNRDELMSILAEVAGAPMPELPPKDSE